MEEATETQKQDEPIEEVTEELKIEDVVKAYEEELNTIKFFTDQTKFNSIMYQGMQIILKKLTTIEEHLNAKKK